MNRKTTFALVLACAAAGTAWADDITMERTPFTSTLERAEVQADLQQFRQSGIDPWSQDYQPTAQFHSERTRMDVTADYLAGRDTVAAFGGEDSGSVYLAKRELPLNVQPHFAALTD